MIELNISDTFTVELPPDPIVENFTRQVVNSAYSFVKPRIPENPGLIHAVTGVADLLGIKKEDLNSEEFLEIFSGKKIYQDSQPYAMCYGGHQFGSWAGQLGDGRAINLFEIKNNGQRWAAQLKGAGATPYSRNADGLAVLRSSIREHLCSEAMFSLGVPTTRSLSLILSGGLVRRDMLYDGNPEMEKGAIICRVSPSFVRFGNFEIFAAQKDDENLAKLCDHVITHFYKDIKTTGKEKYLQFFQELCDRSLDMVIHWLRVGFVHGVMNTDNMSALGLTIDYGPYGWLEGYDEDWTPNTTDKQTRRYRYGQQGNITLWNLYQLANAIYPLIGETEPLEAILEGFKARYATVYKSMMLSKLGIFSEQDEDIQLIEDLKDVLMASETDMTIFFRNLSKIDPEREIDTEGGFLEIVRESFYNPDEIKGEVLDKWRNWFRAYFLRLKSENLTNSERTKNMDLVNPKYVLRNYMAQLAIDAAEKGDYSLVSDLHEMLKNPYDEQPENEKWFAKRPEWARNKVGCSMLSCSS